VHIQHLRKRDAAELKNNLLNLYPRIKDVIERYERFTLIRDEGLEVIAMNGIPAFFIYNGTYTPLILYIKLEHRDLLPKVVVDDGAVKHLLNGADVMAPGITELEDFNTNDLVSVWEPTKQSPIVIGKAILPSDEVKRLKKGKVIKNIHHVGDKIWKLSLKLYKDLSSK